MTTGKFDGLELTEQAYDAQIEAEVEAEIEAEQNEETTPEVTSDIIEVTKVEYIQNKLDKIKETITKEMNEVMLDVSLDITNKMSKLTQLQADLANVSLENELKNASVMYLYQLSDGTNIISKEPLKRSASVTTTTTNNTSKSGSRVSYDAALGLKFKFSTDTEYYELIKDGLVYKLKDSNGLLHTPSNIIKQLTTETNPQGLSHGNYKDWTTADGQTIGEIIGK